MHKFPEPLSFLCNGIFGNTFCPNSLNWFYSQQNILLMSVCHLDFLCLSWNLFCVDFLMLCFAVPQVMCVYDCFAGSWEIAIRHSWKVWKNKTISLLSYRFQLLIYDWYLTMHVFTHAHTHTQTISQAYVPGIVYSMFKREFSKGLIEAVSQEVHDLQITSGTLLVCA